MCWSLAFAKVKKKQRDTYLHCTIIVKLEKRKTTGDTLNAHTKARSGMQIAELYVFALYDWTFRCSPQCDIKINTFMRRAWIRRSDDNFMLIIRHYSKSPLVRLFVTITEDCWALSQTPLSHRHVSRKLNSDWELRNSKKNLLSQFPFSIFPENQLSDSCKPLSS